MYLLCAIISCKLYKLCRCWPIMLKNTGKGSYGSGHFCSYSMEHDIQQFNIQGMLQNWAIPLERSTDRYRFYVVIVYVYVSLHALSPRTLLIDCVTIRRNGLFNRRTREHCLARPNSAVSMLASGPCGDYTEPSKMTSRKRWPDTGVCGLA